MLKNIIAAMAKMAQMQASQLDDVQALEVQVLFPEWQAGKVYAVGARVNYKGVLYKCLTTHASQDGWVPDTAPSLWAKVLTDPSGGILPWEQPDSTNGYMTGDRVMHNGKTWESLVDNNIWEPGAPGAESLWKEVGIETPV